MSAADLDMPKEPCGSGEAHEVGRLTIFSGGTTPYTIYHDPKAPQSVVDAANDLKAVILAATEPNVTINIISASVPSGPMICLGANATATEAGATITAEMANGGFRIKTVCDNLYIVGADTTVGQRTAMGGFLRGTRDGVSHLWEQYLDARYLMPGPDGLDVAIRSSMSVPAQDTIKLPGFIGRDLGTVGGTLISAQGIDPPTPNEVDVWLQGNRVGRAIDVERGHSWSDYPSRSSPEPAWMALSTETGTSRDPVDSLPQLRKYCTTNKSLQAAFALALNNIFNAEPSLHESNSMSPTDGIGGCFCTDPGCKCYVDNTSTSYHGFNLSRTRQILKWYGDVATTLYSKYPTHADKRLGGYVYNEYNLPPSGSPIPLHPNIELYYAPRHWYGMMLFKTGALAHFQTDVAAWAALYPNQFSYSDYPMWGGNAFSGAPICPGLDVLGTIIASLHSVNARHVLFYCNSAWGWAGLKNYCLARKMWDPSLSLTALKDEYLTRCYGAGATAMGQTYDLLDRTWRDYINTRPLTPGLPDWMTDLTDAMIAATCGQNWAIFEANYVAARRAIDESNAPSKMAQLNRLKMFGKNLAVLHYRLRHMGNPGMNASPYTISIDGDGPGFYMDDTAFGVWRGIHANDLALEEDWNKLATGIGTYKDFVYDINHNDLDYAPGTKVDLPTSAAIGGNRFNARGGSVQLWASFTDSLNNGAPTAKNQVVFTSVAGGGIPYVSCTVGEHDCAVLGLKEFKAKLWVDSGGPVANFVNFVFLDLAMNHNVGIFRLNLATNKVESANYIAPNLVSGDFITVAAYTRGMLIDVKANIFFDPARPRIEYYVNNPTSIPNVACAMPKWCEIRKINIIATGATIGRVAMDDISFR